MTTDTTTTDAPHAFVPAAGTDARRELIRKAVFGAMNGVTIALLFGVVGGFLHHALEFSRMMVAVTGG